MSPETSAANAMPTADWLTVADVARVLRVGERCVRAAIKSGKLRAARLNERGDLRIAQAWMRAWVEASTQDGRRDRGAA